MRLSTCLLVLCAFVSVLCAQDYRATISGAVTDKSKSAIPGAKVRAVRIDSNEAVQVETNGEGYFTIPFLNPAKYSLEVTADGFQRHTRTGVTLMVADKLELDIELEVGRVSDQVTVYAEQDLLKTGDASTGTSFDPLQMEEYALNGRQVYMLMSLAPGVLFTQEQFGATGFSGTRGWDVNGEYVINGGVKGTNQFLLNGAPVSLTGSWQLAPNVEAIQEFKVMTSTYDAQFGRTGGGTVNTTLKSGTNRWHGALFEYMRNNVLDANTTQNNRVGAPRGKHITHQFGGTYGGMIRKERDYVFFSFEGFRERVPFPVVTDTVPMDLRDGKNFSNYRIKIYDPLTNHICQKGVDTTGNANCFSTYVRTPFPLDEIPASRISAIGKKILGLWPAPNFAAQTQNFYATNNVGKYHYDQPMGRWDHHFTPKDRVYGIVTFQHGWEDRNSTGFPEPAQTGNIISQRTSQNYIADWVHVFNSAMVLDLRASFGRFTSYFPDGERDFGLTAQALGMNLPTPPTVARATAPHVNLDLYTGIIGNTYTWSTDNQWSLAPSITRIHGRHTTKYGAEFVLAGRGSGGPGRANGEFSFNRTWTQQSSTRGGDRYDGSGIADLLLGLPASGFIDYNDTYYRKWPYWAVYVQDDWKVARNLTLNLGLRYDVQIPFVELRDRVNAGFDFNVVNPLSDQILANWRKVKAEYDATDPRWPYPDPPKAIYGGKQFINGDRHTYDTDWTDVQPRVGLAWAVKPKFVIRTGFGIYYRTATQGNYTDGFSQRTNYNASLTGGVLPSAGLTGPYSLENPFPNGYISPSGTSLGLLTNIGRGVGFDARQRPIPRTYQYSFGFQLRLPRNMMIDVSYAGSQTVHDSMGAQLDYVPYSTFLQGQANSLFLDRKVPNPFWGILPLNADFGNSPDITARDLSRPYPEFNGISQSTSPWAKYRYDALQVRLEKRFFGDRKTTGALSLVVSYTFAKTFEANHRLNDWHFDESPIHELSNYDKPQNIAFSGVWDLPFGKGRKWLASSARPVRAVVSGWNYNWIYTYNSGYPVSWPDALFSCATYDPVVQTPASWINNDNSCYRGRAPYTLRVVPDRFPNIRNPSGPQLNMTLARTFRIGERYSFQLRGETFNATNTPLYNGPVTDFRDPRFGQLPIQQRNFPRLVQIAAKILW